MPTEAPPPTPEELREMVPIAYGPLDEGAKAAHAYGQRCFEAGRSAGQKPLLEVLAAIEKLAVADGCDDIATLAHIALDEAGLHHGGGEDGRELLAERDAAQFEAGKAAALEGPVWIKQCGIGHTESYLILNGEVVSQLVPFVNEGIGVSFVRGGYIDPDKRFPTEAEARAAVEESVRNG